INTQSSMAFPWHWNGTDAVLPEADGEAADNVEVYRFRFSGNEQQEALWEIVQPDDSTIRFSVGLRRQIGLISLPSDDRNDKDLRLVYGSALDRHLGDTALRSRIGSKVASLDLQGELDETGQTALSKLDERFLKNALPAGISLGLVSSQGISIGALVGLLAAKSPETDLPLSAWGAGTRRLASLEIGASNDENPTVVTIDEIERGLEPYRLRQLLNGLLQQHSQVFITTHSPVAISSVPEASLWYMDSHSQLGALRSDLVSTQQKNDPETFLARVAVIAEGLTEVGFLEYLLEKALGSQPLDHGIRVCNGQGNDHTLALLRALSESGLKFAGLADNEGRDAGNWRNLKAAMGDLLLQWTEGCTEEAVIAAIPDDRIHELIGVEGDEKLGNRLRHLQIRSGAEERTLDSIRVALAPTGKTLKQLVIETASGNNAGAPEGDGKAWKSQSRDWFKSRTGGAELAEKAISLGGWDSLSPRLLPLLKATFGTLDLAVSENFPNV
ncbi:ATP-binding protein, partial [Pseudorhodobacter sp. E13]|uniref:ATP-dependent nuclease n=1 Tax=Pseudorhodobacter sp. E13 TaxID=2487931 RepID=UPI000F8C4BDB